MTEEEKKKAFEEYAWSHYYIGGTIISGHDIVKIEMKFPPIGGKKAEREDSEVREGK